MKGIMVASENCRPCQDLKIELADLIASGEIEVVSLEKDEQRAYELMQQYGLGLPGVVIVGNNGQVIAKLE